MSQSQQSPSAVIMADQLSTLASSLAGANADSSVRKPSIFVCKTCKSNTVEVEKKPK